LALSGGVAAVLALSSACPDSFGGVPLGDDFADDDFPSTARFTPANVAHRLTQLCGTRCFVAAATTPLVRTSASTALRCFFVYFRLFLDAIAISARPRPQPGYVRD